MHLFHFIQDRSSPMPRHELTTRGSQITMFARKRRDKASQKSSGFKQKDDGNIQKPESANYIKTSDYKSDTRNINRFKEEFGFSLKDIKSWENFIYFLYKPMDPASLGLIRSMFGFMMVLDIPEERGLADADINWGDANECRFPLFSFLQPLPLQWMCIVYLIMWIGAFGIMLGIFFHMSCLAFIIPYWYLFLLDKTSWNNHSYLYGIISILLLGSQANHYWSLDVILGRITRNSPVPLWNYFILRFQIFVLYFFAGLKKLDRDWLEGYSMKNLSNHWVFLPFRLLLNSEQVDYWIIHLNGFALDLSIGFFLLWNKTRPYALFILGLFHVMNSRLFTIGMFPYVCLVTMPIFCNANWPRELFKMFQVQKSTVKNSEEDEDCTSSLVLTQDNKQEAKIKKLQEVPTYTMTICWKHNLVVFLLISHMGLQCFLPYSHFITKGYNNWTNGLYGYSWDMMVHTWDTVLVVIKVVDQETGKEHFLDPEAWVQTDRWEKHADMLIQYAQCLKRNLLKGVSKESEKANNYNLSNNISIHIDVWCSLNGRFQQRMFDPRVDLLTADWSPVKEVTWLMPLLTEFSSWRKQIADLEEKVYSWSNYSDALFVADFPDLALENYINADLNNVTLTVLEGEVIVETEQNESFETNQSSGKSELNILSQRIGKNEFVKLPSGKFHRVHTVSQTPSCYMYSYVNRTKQLQEEQDGFTSSDNNKNGDKKSGGLWSEFIYQMENIARAIGLVSNAVLNVLYSVPMVKRIRVA